MSMFNKRRNRFLCKSISALSAISCVVCQNQRAFANFSFKEAKKYGIYKLTDVFKEANINSPGTYAQTVNIKMPDGSSFEGQIQTTDNVMFLGEKKLNEGTKYYFAPQYKFSEQIKEKFDAANTNEPTTQDALQTPGKETAVLSQNGPVVTGAVFIATHDFPARFTPKHTIIHYFMTYIPNGYSCEPNEKYCYTITETKGGEYKCSRPKYMDEKNENSIPTTTEYRSASNEERDKFLSNSGEHMDDYEIKGNNPPVFWTKKKIIGGTVAIITVICAGIILSQTIPQK